jgi:hypothetical protein
VKAKEMASRQRKAADDFTTTFPEETVTEWKKMVKDWQGDPKLPNPYVSNEQGMFSKIIQLLCLTVVSPASKLSEARLRLTQEEVAEAERGRHTPHKISASVFIRMGLDLEDQQ